MHRRFFLKASASYSALALAGAAGADLLRAMSGAGPKKILILGGTQFLGPAVVEAAIVAGHSVTLFNRGVTNPDLFPFLERLRGYRSPTASDENFGALGTRRWDVVIDVWPFDPAVVESAARRLSDRTSRYIWVSSIAAYDPSEFARPNLTESGSTLSWTPGTTTYGRGKAESERRLVKLLGDRVMIVRPGPIKGNRDDGVDLLTWLRRSQAGGTHIGPGSGDDHVQMVDVNDVARFIIASIDQPLTGFYNLTGAPMTFREFVGRCTASTRSRAEFVWIPPDFLHTAGLDPDPLWRGPFPFWHPEPARRGFFQISSQKAFDAGWTQRPFQETATDVLWYIDRLDPWVWDFTDALPPETEARVLKAWLDRGKT